MNKGCFNGYPWTMRIITGKERYVVDAIRLEYSL